MRFWAIAALVVAVLFIDGCGGGGSTPVVKVSISPQSVTLRGGDTQRFIGSAYGAMNSTVTWSVNGKPGGDASVGTIDSAGIYTARFSSVHWVDSIPTAARSSSSNRCSLKSVKL